MTFEQILTTYQVGSEYVTIPSLPMRADVKDTFTVVAVHDDTRVKVILMPMLTLDPTQWFSDSSEGRG